MTKAASVPSVLAFRGKCGSDGVADLLKNVWVLYAFGLMFTHRIYS